MIRKFAVLVTLGLSVFCTAPVAAQEAATSNAAAAAKPSDADAGASNDVVSAAATAVGNSDLGRPENNWLIAIGVNQFDDKENVNQLQYCSSDARAVYDFFITSGFVTKEHSYLLVSDSASPELQPTNVAIIKAIKYVAKQAGQDSTILLSFSGHGFVDETTEESYLFPKNGNRDALEESAVSCKRVNEILAGSRAARKVLFIDACRNSPLRGEKGSAAAVASESFFKALQSGRGQVTLFSCDVGQASYEMPEARQSAFTHFLLEGLHGAARPDEHNLITLFSIHEYLSKAVPEWCRSKQKQPQEPHVFGDMGRTIPLAILRGGQNAAGLSTEQLRAAELQQKRGQLLQVVRANVDSKTITQQVCDEIDQALQASPESEAADQLKRKIGNLGKLGEDYRSDFAQYWESTGKAAFGKGQPAAPVASAEPQIASAAAGGARFASAVQQSDSSHISVDPGQPLADVVNSAAAGAEIELKPGKHNGGFVVKDKKVILIGSGAAILQSSNLPCIQVEGSGEVELRQLNVQHQSGSGASAAALLVQNGGKLKLQDCIVFSTLGTGVLASGIGAQLVMNGGTVQRCGSKGLKVMNGAEADVTDTKFDSNEKYGIVAQDGGQVSLTSVVINETQDGPGLVATGANTKATLKVRSQVTRNSTVGIDCDKEAVVQVEGRCVIQENHDSGIVVSDDGKIVVADSRISRNGLSGIEVGDDGRLEVKSGSSILQNSQYGIIAEPSTKGLIENADVRGNEKGEVNLKSGSRIKYADGAKN